MIFKSKRVKREKEMRQNDMIKEVINQCIVRLRSWITSNSYAILKTTRTVDETWFQSHVMFEYTFDNDIRSSKLYVKVKDADGIVVYRSKDRNTASDFLYIIYFNKDKLVKKYRSLLNVHDSIVQIPVLRHIASTFVDDLINVLSDESIIHSYKNYYELRIDIPVGSLTLTNDIALSVYWYYIAIDRNVAKPTLGCSYSDHVIEIFSSLWSVINELNVIKFDINGSILLLPHYQYNMNDVVAWTTKLVAESFEKSTDTDENSELGIDSNRHIYTISFNWLKFLDNCNTKTYEKYEELSKDDIIDRRKLGISIIISDMLELLLHEIAHVCQYSGYVLIPEYREVPEGLSYVETEKIRHERLELEAEKWAAQKSCEVCTSEIYKDHIEKLKYIFDKEYFED